MNKRSNWLLIVLAAIGVIVVVFFVLRAINGNNIAEDIGEGIENVGDEVKDAVN